MTCFMNIVTVSKAKAGFSKLTRGVIVTRQPVVVRTPAGFVQIIPYDLLEEVPPAGPDALNLLPREIELQNTFGETL
jgi:hypothetical protein